MSKPAMIRVALRNVGHVDPRSLGEYTAVGGYSGLERVFELAQADKHTLQMYVEHTAPAQEEPAATDEAPAAEEKKAEE